MDLSVLGSPVAFLSKKLGKGQYTPVLENYESWWNLEGKEISTLVDRHGTPWVQRYDTSGNRLDKILYPKEYDHMLYKGYEAGIIWRAFEDSSLLPHYLLGYLTSYFDPGLYCPYTVSMATAAPFFKYGEKEIKEKYFKNLLKKDVSVWQGATWMTEIKGGSDLGANVDTIASPAKDHFLLNGEKYFCSNAHAEIAVVAARIKGAPQNIKGLALFLVPRKRDDGTLNYAIDRLKDKIATHSVPTGEITLKDSVGYLLGTETGIYQIMEVLNISRTANCMASVGLAQRALYEAYQFAKDRVAFGKPIIDQPLLQAQFEEKTKLLDHAFALAWETVILLDEVWLETPPYSDRHDLFRLMAHLGKYWTAEYAVQTAKWAMEVNGGLGTLHEFPVERWLREAMILSIWEGTPHRQILDGLEVMEKKGAHKLLLAHLTPFAAEAEIRDWEKRIEEHLGLSQEEKEGKAESLFSDLAAFTANRLLHKNSL